MRLCCTVSVERELEMLLQFEYLYLHCCLESGSFEVSFLMSPVNIVKFLVEHLDTAHEWRERHTQRNIGVCKAASIEASSMNIGGLIHEQEHYIHLKFYNRTTMFTKMPTPNSNTTMSNTSRILNISQ